MLFRESVDILTKWLNENDQTHPEQPSGSLSPLPWHVGTRLFADLGPMSPTLQQAAASQDVIGWIEFLHGKVSTDIADIQKAYCSLSSCRMNGCDWMKHFVSHLLHIVSHSQWVFRNWSTRGYLRLQHDELTYSRLRLSFTPTPTTFQQRANFCWTWTSTPFTMRHPASGEFMQLSNKRLRKPD